MGNILTPEGLCLDPSRVEDIVQVPPPQNRKELQLRQTTARAVNNACVLVFATHGIPAKLCSDNGPPFNNACSYSFAAQLEIARVTSSPYSPRGNSMAERTVQELKKLLTKCPFATLEFYSALLEWRNMPRDEQLKSPIQRLMGRKTRTQLPVLPQHLPVLPQPQTVPPQSVRNRLYEFREKQRIFCYRAAKRLPHLRTGSPVPVCDTIRRTWSPAVPVDPAGTPRSYTLLTDSGQELRHTREHLSSKEMQPMSDPEGTVSAESVSQPDHMAELQPEAILRRSDRLRRPPQRYPLPERRQH
ncbi:uncharacterized protein LOC144129454 [Amblyomma americanum]